jgi:sacsin
MPPPASPREHVERIRRERYFIGRGEQNPLAEDMHQAVNYLSQELYSKDVHFLMELVQVSAIPLIFSCSCVIDILVRSSVFPKFCKLFIALDWIHHSSHSWPSSS